MWSINVFDFTSIHLRDDGHTVDFIYTVDGTQLTETLVFHTQRPITRSPLVQRILEGLHLMLGISYYKAFCPPRITLSGYSLSPEQARFWNNVYTKGLGQFFFEHTIDYRNRIQFPSHNTRLTPIETTRTGRFLVPIGGGKDSLTTVALLKKHRQAFDLFTLGSHDVLHAQIAQLNTHHVHVSRTLDPQLFAWNAQGAFNGHIPISAIFSWVALLCAAVDGYQYIALSNEASANEGNVEYLGTEINHQWSKSLEYERLFQEYVRSYITPDITYFSLLRPYSEVLIARLFAQECESFFSTFTSCNRNFAITTAASQRWCGACPKCAFVFALLSPYIPQTTLVSIFNKNLFADTTLIPLYKELLGIKDFKPFECVGTPREMMYVCALAHRANTYANTPVMNMFADEVLPHMPAFSVLEKEIYTLHEHAIPPELHSLIYEF